MALELSKKIMFGNNYSNSGVLKMCLLCARYCARCFIDMIALNPHWTMRVETRSSLCAVASLLCGVVSGG